jgi:hypothetical protein
MRRSIGMWIFFLITALIGVFPAAAETVDRGSVCYKIVVEFEADVDTVISGQIGIHYFDDDRSELVNVVIGTQTFDDEESRKVAEVKVNDMRDFRVTLNTDGTIISGDGEYHKHVVGCSVFYINDGRLNINQLGSLAIIYKNSATGGYDLYAVNPETGEGKMVIRTTRDAVNQALGRAITDGSNTLIQTSGAISLWALTSNECQMNSFNLDGSLDEFVFDCVEAD